MSPAEAGASPGSAFLAEIREQPAALRRLLEHDGEIARVAATARERDARLVRIVGHGSSDNAASFGVYAFGLLPRWTAMRDSITLTVHYDTPLDMSGSTVIGLSQSGRTPDVVEYIRGRARAGAFTIAVTNEPASELAPPPRRRSRSAPSRSSPSRRRRRTSTRSRRWRCSRGTSRAAAPRSRTGIREVADLLEAALRSSSEATAALALPFAYTGRMFVIGRGVEFATAREIALKLLETCRIAAEPLTATDLAHGPVAALDPLFPVWAIASHDGTLAPVQEAAARIRAMGATLVASGTAAAPSTASAYRCRSRRRASRCSRPCSPSSRGSCSRCALSRARGLDADAPHGLAKVTLAA